MSPPPDPGELIRAFHAAGGRARQALIARLLEGASRQRLAATYGISIEAADVLVFRALAELETALKEPARAPPPALPLPDLEEQAAASALAAALDRGDEEVKSPLLRSRHQLARAVAAAAPELRRALVPPPTPPPTRREKLRETARRMLWLALVIAAAVLYSRWRAQ